MINEEIILNKVEEVLNDKLTVLEFNNYFNEFIITNDKSKYNIVKRIINSYSKMKLNKSNGYDFFTNLRQFINTFKRRVEVGNFVANKLNNLDNIDLYLEMRELSKERYLINSKEATFKDLNDKNVLNDFKSIYEKKEGNSEWATGDWRLKTMTGFNKYKSPCQKFIIRALEKQNFGTTILATMKTGGGKSLLVQYIAKHENKGTTIVVLPTIALTMDQEESSKRFFKDDHRKVYAYYDGVDKYKRQEIFNNLISGNVAVLYMSPEAILNGAFYDKIMECAKRNILDRIVIDEAHLVVDWGESFRPEFQFLSAFRRKILRLTGGRLKTLLVSATITEKSQKVLKRLYSEENKFIEIRGDSLRDEIVFYKINCTDNEDRIEKVKNIISVIPKPMILYVPIIKSAHEYYNLIKELGSENVEMFTSETSSESRKDILERWNDDRIDIIVATAAFGMGVDKKEVRSIVHTFIPESIDRFYQEVGRGGRDGYRSYSFIFTAREDHSHIKFFTSSKVLLAKNIVDRWYGMMKDPYEKISGDEYWVSVKGIPNHLLDNPFLGKTNEAWNEYVILFLYRNKFLDILDIKIDELSKSRLLHIKLKELDIINDFEKFYNEVDRLREIDRSYVLDDITSIKEMIRDNKICWGKRFEKIYKYSEIKCLGCPVCRKHNNEIIIEKDYFEIVQGDKLLLNEFNSEIEKEEKLFINLENNICDMLEEILNICKKEGIENLVLPNEKMCNEIIDGNVESNSYIYNYLEAINIEENLLRGIVGIVLMSGNDIENDKLFKKYRMQYRKEKIKKLIFISDKHVYIKSECRDIEECIDNVSYIRSRAYVNKG